MAAQSAAITLAALRAAPLLLEFEYLHKNYYIFAVLFKGIAKLALKQQSESKRWLNFLIPMAS